MSSKAEEYRAKALEADLKAQGAADETVRTVYQELARGWLQVAAHAEWLAHGAQGDPPSVNIVNNSPK